MRIAICTKNDLFGAIVLNSVLPRLTDHTVGVFMSVRERPELEDSIQELDLMRMVERQVPLEILFPLLDAVGRQPGCFGTPSQLAAQIGAEVTLISDMRPDGGTAVIEAFAPDLVLSVRFSYLFRRSTIALAKAGIINVHPGPLPGYRGLYAPFWQLVRGNDVVRCTVHLVDPGIDTGPMLSIVDVPVKPGRSMLWHAAQLYLAGADRAVDYILGGLPEAQPQDETLAGKNEFPAPADFARFRAAGFSLVRGGDYSEFLAPFIRPPAEAA